MKPKVVEKIRYDNVTQEHDTANHVFKKYNVSFLYL